MYVLAKMSLQADVTSDKIRCEIVRNKTYSYVILLANVPDFCTFLYLR